MTNFLRLQCPGCNARIKAPIQLVGQARPCPKCGQEIYVQRQAPEDSDAILIGLDGRDVMARQEQSDTKLILVADDDMALNDGLRSMLEKHGYRVVQAADGVQAKEIVRHQRPDLVILDMMMPRMGGLPVLEQMPPEGPPVIMISAEDSAKHKSQAERLGVVEFLRKPFGMGRLLDSVQKGLEQSS